MKNNIITVTISMILLTINASIYAGEVNGLTDFTSGAPARASEVNGNFQSTKTAVDDNHARIIALETTNATLLSRIADLEAKLANVSVITHNGQPTVRFEGVNVQIVNGMGGTGTSNGSGNLLIGYDENDASGTFHCDIGSNPGNGHSPVLDETTCLAAGGGWVDTGFKTGSHYLVLGSQNNYSRFGGIVSGYRNTSNYDYSNVTGGWNNTSSGLFSNVSGGGFNTANGGAASVTGGIRNEARGGSSSIGGGTWNLTTAIYSSISGGGDGTEVGRNIADNAYSSILGGVGQNTSTNSQTIPALP